MQFKIFMFFCMIWAYTVAHHPHKDKDNQSESVKTYKASRHDRHHSNHVERFHRHHSNGSDESEQDEYDKDILKDSLAIAKRQTEPDKYKLEQLQVLFRHGDRTPTIEGFYEGDPYNEIYRSYGLGQLTKVGKQHVYETGRFLRKRYDAFLGEYRSGTVYAYSADADRTKMSLQLVLAGLYPPTPSTSWSDSINWQPIPTYYETNDVSFLTAPRTSAEYMKLYDKSANTSEVLEILQKHEELFQRIKNSTGFTISTLYSISPLYGTLCSDLSLGLPLPDWCSEEDFQKIKRINAIIFKTMTRTEQLRRMLAGPIAEQFLKVLSVNGTSEKIYLYGGHDINIAAFIDAHNITGGPDLYDYGSALILEKLRGPDDRTYVSVYLWTGASEKFMSLKFNDCEKICPLSDYVQIVQPILPNDAPGKLKISIYLYFYIFIFYCFQFY